MANALSLTKDISNWSIVKDRQCGDCNLCCRVMPVNDPNLVKHHNVRCQHMRHTGCKIYSNRPGMCRHWECGWLQGIGVDKISRPDRSGYIIDTLADFCSINSIDQAMIVVWVDPRRPEDWRNDKALFEMFERWGRQGFGAIVRYNQTLNVCVFPPSLTGYTDWIITEPREANLPEIDPDAKLVRAAKALSNGL